MGFYIGFTSNKASKILAADRTPGTAKKVLTLDIEGKKVKILDTAEEIISGKGMAQVKMTEIAQRAGVAYSLIYQYFKGKEDLLFAIPGRRMKEVLSQLDEHLQGILDAEARLRKMVWFDLWYKDTHTGYAKILMLDCRSTKDFYTSPAYQLVRQYAGILSGILKKGVEDGTFKQDLNINLMRDIILGTLDSETITCLATREINESVPDLDDIMSLVYAMATPERDVKGCKSERIIMAAERVFGEEGFLKAKISEIARLADVAEGTVYEYFKNKEDLFLSIPGKRFKQYYDEQGDLFQRSALGSLKRFLRYNFSILLTEEKFLKVFLLRIQLNRRFYGSKAYESYRNYSRVIEKIIEQGKEEGSFRSDVNPRVFRNMFFGTFSNLGLRWLNFKRDNESQKIHQLVQAMELLCSAVTADNLKGGDV